MKQALALIVLLILLLQPAQTRATEDHIEYNISVNTDCSATWKIIQATDINSTIDSLEQFQQRIIATINSAQESSSRNMTLDFSSLEMKTDVHWESSSQTIEYIFRWENFSSIEKGKLVFGDILNADLFASFYGHGELYVTYPAQYSISSVSPRPDEEVNATNMIHWYRTQDLPMINTSITLTKNSSVNSFPTEIIAIAASAILCTVIALLFINHRRASIQNLKPTIKPPLIMDTQNSEEKILCLLKSSGGKAKQSEICTILRFSRAKTSLLLAQMEKNNQIRRDKKGKNKIVYLTDRKPIT